jgi:hypothetical protein
MHTKSTSTNGRYCRAPSLRRWGTVGPAVTCVNLNGTRKAKRLNPTQTQFTTRAIGTGHHGSELQDKLLQVTVHSRRQSLLHAIECCVVLASHSWP